MRNEKLCCSVIPNFASDISKPETQTANYWEKNFDNCAGEKDYV